MATPPVLVVGAGPSGLALALRLTMQGLPVRIVERRAGPGEASRATVVHARTLELYRQMGFGDEVVARGIVAEALLLREDEETVARFDFGDLGRGLSPYPFVLCYPQDDHERFLVERLTAAGVKVEWETELTAFEETEGGVRATLTKGGREEMATFAYLAGCDGAHSTVRHGLGIDFPGGTYDQLFYVADATLTGGQRREVGVKIQTDAFALLFPVRRTGAQRIVGNVPPEFTGRDDLTFEEIRPVAESLAGDRVEAIHWFTTYRVHHRVAAHFRVGRVFLCGDAGHIHSPAGGQGMNTGIGDAINLAWKLADVLEGRADDSILDTYETERLAFARTLVATTDRVFTTLIGHGLESHLVRDVLLPHVLPFVAGFTPVRRAAFAAVSQTSLHYGASALSEGHAGHVEGGDRLPWVPYGEGDNFAPLTSLGWQVHVYGETKPALREAVDTLDLPLHLFPFSDEAETAGLAWNAAYLVRPDGYVALASPGGDATTLHHYVERHGLRFGS